ncbi:hypothetical protein Agabi119p4_5871 [Agaricus bisporus var. burnettii]|uniref:Enoyl reductase (ER) domain-containing protein n=1 Tax=Agaricus bisporus var. burnettii TaxID=192524 RepID=A0A8H7F0S6_AGABI|nr:hypothetical protein Agabi119p4_5871 [Agaricus bisporus var. burnettii]
MPELPQQQKALFLESKQGDFVVKTRAVPKPGPGQALIQVKAAALNPVDWKIQKYGIYVTDFPAILGTDVSGVIVAIGEGITKFNVGDKVFCQGKIELDYADFQQYALVDEHHLAKIPANINFDQAATMPLGVTTAFLLMYNKPPHGHGLVNPIEAPGHYKDQPFVVLGGSANVGQNAIQFAKLSGFNPIIATASLKHTDFLKSLGATHVLDRNLSAQALKAEIEKITTKPVKHVCDAISLAETQQTGVEILAPGGHLMLVLAPTVSSDDKHILNVVAFRHLEPNVEQITAMYGKLSEWVEKGIIKPNNVEVLPGGLNGIVGGFKRMEANQVSGLKLVVHPEETT